MSILSDSFLKHLNFRPIVLCAALLFAGICNGFSEIVSRRAVRGPELDRASSASPLNGEALVHKYFERRVSALESRSLNTEDLQSLEKWEARQARLRLELQEMLGLAPWPARTDLKPVITGQLDQEDYTVEKLHFQSSPGLYVTANLYLPKGLKQPAPTILYVCGHSHQIDGDISYGNKTGYHHHGVWFARNGYVCLMVDTLQLGEIQGIHHGTYRYGRWDWAARGYTPAGVEAWNSIRAIDYLETREEVDASRIGITGRSGGGAYSWWTAALDERIKVAVPVAGITDLHNHVVDGVVSGHCDCMFMVNTFGWDYPLVAAMVAPRPLLLANSDKDTIFPLDGVIRTHSFLRQVYQLYGEENSLGLLITEGPHQDTQELRIPAFHWFNRFLKNEDPLIEMAAPKVLDRRDLKVFAELPTDEINTKVDESFVPELQLRDPSSIADWSRMKGSILGGLRDLTFASWNWERDFNQQTASVGMRRIYGANVQLKGDGYDFQIFEMETEPGYPLRAVRMVRSDLAIRQTSRSAVIKVSNEADWKWLCEGLSSIIGENAQSLLQPEGSSIPELSSDKLSQLSQLLSAAGGEVWWVAPRGIGPTQWGENSRDLIQIRRRFQLIGETIDGMRVWDVRRFMSEIAPYLAARVDGLNGLDVQLEASEDLGGIALMALALHAERIGDSLGSDRINWGLKWIRPTALLGAEGPVFLNQRKVFAWPQALAMVLEYFPVELVMDEDQLETLDQKTMGWLGEWAEVVQAHLSSRLNISAISK